MFVSSSSLTMRVSLLALICSLNACVPFLHRTEAEKTIADKTTFFEDVCEHPQAFPQYASNLRFIRENIFPHASCHDILARKNSLKSLYIFKQELQNLDLLDQFSKLETLEIIQSKIRDINNISNFARLEELRILETPLVDLDVLRGMRSLKTFVIADTKIKDLSFLQDLHTLTHLSIEENIEFDLNMLHSLRLLKHLSINSQAIKNISGLAECTQLEELALVEIKSIDLSQLNLSGLQELKIVGGEVQNIKSLANLPNLKTLYIKNCKLQEEDLKKLKAARPELRIQYARPLFKD